MKIRKANKNDEEFIKELHQKSNMGNFNLFWVWINFWKAIRIILTRSRR